MKTIGDKVKRLLDERGWTQEDFEKKSGISQAFISQIVNGNKKPGYDTIQKLAKVKNQPPDLTAGEFNRGE